MPIEEWVKVDSLNVHSYYSRGSIVIFGKLIRWQFFRTCRKKTLSGELSGYFWMKSCTGAVLLIGFLYLESGKLLVMPRC
ncbi:hypothetical protein Godav_025224 [Gossypium davidsonii]|uniref:Uncharacterized protein n=1 Tax=Gossypium davidsonii TaxID=34287 RepID=A0A7J8TB11_GOSDV|nr:hypothetical protein [Gossypium davidsonii]